MAQPYPHEPVCYPETVYSTVYSEPADHHTFTASGIDETVSASPVYHTMDSTIVETVTATPTPVEVLNAVLAPGLSIQGSKMNGLVFGFHLVRSPELTNPPLAAAGLFDSILVQMGLRLSRPSLSP